MGNFRTLALSIVLQLCGGYAFAETLSHDIPWVMSVAPDSEYIQAAPEKSRIVVFRVTHAGVNAAPVNVFVNGDYHVSLLPENRAWIVEVCPGQAEVVVSPANQGLSLSRDNWETRNSKGVKAGEIAFYQVDMDDSGRGVGRFVDQSQAMDLVKGLPVQNHVISRVSAAVNCLAEVVRLNASALFGFDRSDMSGMKDGSEKAIQDLAARINREYVSVDRVVVKGYTDPDGGFDYNMRLSRNRADTVASILMESGLQRSLVYSEGLGPQNLLVTGCAQQHSAAAARIECNQPNRRVEVEIYGVKGNR